MGADRDSASPPLSAAPPRREGVRDSEVGEQDQGVSPNNAPPPLQLHPHQPLGHPLQWSENTRDNLSSLDVPSLIPGPRCKAWYE